MIAQIAIPLDIPDVTIEHVDITEQAIHITVTSTIEETRCHKCGRPISYVHGHDNEITLRHLSILGKPTYIHLRPVRFRCFHCKDKPTTTQKLSWYVPRSPHTTAYDEHLLLSLIKSTVEDVSLKEGVGYKAVEGVIDRSIQRRVNWKQISRLDAIGLDEISLKKGHKKYVTIVSGRRGEQTVILAVLKNRQKVTVKAFLQSIPPRIRRHVVAVCCDMYEGFVNAAKDVFGKGIVIIDRFHVAKLYRGALDTLRKKELKRLKRELSEEEYKKLNGAMWVLRKQEKDLTEEERRTLETLFQHSPSLQLAYAFSQELTAIFNQDLSRRQAQHKIKVWKKRVKASELTCFKGFMKTLGTYLKEILNYFLNRHTSGFVEGLNNTIKVIKRRCYGILNVDHLYQRIYLDLEGYTLLR